MLAIRLRDQGIGQRGTPGLDRPRLPWAGESLLAVRRLRDQVSPQMGDAAQPLLQTTWGKGAFADGRACRLVTAASGRPSPIGGRGEDDEQ
jgi:hypothetical protein